jgi:hypothetical protein
MSRLGLVVTLLASFMSSVGSTQETLGSGVPNLIHCQGTLRDSTRTAVKSSTAGVMFAICKQQDGGAPLWQETALQGSLP